MNLGGDKAVLAPARQHVRNGPASDYTSTANGASSSANGANSTADDEGGNPACAMRGHRIEWLVGWLGARPHTNLALTGYWRNMFVSDPPAPDSTLGRLLPFNPLHIVAVKRWLRARFGGDERMIGGDPTKNYLAFQWRTETINSNKLAGCAVTLAAKMSRLREAAYTLLSERYPAPELAVVDLGKSASGANSVGDTAAAKAIASAGNGNDVLLGAGPGQEMGVRLASASSLPGQGGHTASNRPGPHDGRR